jgi:LysR family hydrogen peroxide-inducible transcriptional activator
MQIPTTKQLRYFTALVEHRHFGRAAAACFVSQSAFSIGIQELESLLKVRLVDRTHKRVVITRLGEELATQARLCLRDIETLVELARAQREPLSGALRLGVIPTIAPFLLPRLMPALRKAFPKLELYLKEDLTQRIYEALMAGELDAILYAEPYDLMGVTTRELFNDAFVLAYHDGTALIDPKRYTFNRLNSQSVLLLEDGHCLRNHAIAACRIRDFAKVRPFSATSLTTLVQMVDSDLGITFLPEMALDSALLRGTRVKTQPLKEKSYRAIALAWRKGSARGEEFSTLGEFIRKHYKDQTAS